jgi:hypothetical protein
MWLLEVKLSFRRKHSLQAPVRLHVNEPELWMFDAAVDSVDGSTGVCVGIAAGVFDITVERYQQGRAIE